MKRQLFALGAVVILAVALANPASAASRGTTFTPLGLFPTCDQVPEGEFCEDFPLTTAVSMTADGQTIAGMHAFFSGNYIWTAETGLQTIGPVSGAPWIAGNGSQLTTTPYLPPDYSNDQSAYWTGGFYPDATFDPIPLADGFARCDASGQSSFGISDDGSVVVGLTWIDHDMNGNGCEGAIGFVWDGATISTLDNSLRPGEHNRPNAVNRDGSVIVGFQQTNQREAAKWVNGVESFICPDPIGAGGVNFCTEGWDVTSDGSSILTSMATPEDFNTRATIVDLAGNYTQLPFPDAPYDPSFDSFTGRAISDDGKTVVGSFGGGGFFGSPPYPVLWNEDLGFTLDVQVFLLGQGLDDLFFWYLDDATAVNGNGTIIAGSGTNPDGWIEAWTVDLSRVKVCHKPEGNGVGNQRTVAIAWDAVPGHLGHGDILATCEFALGGGNSRAMETRAAMVGTSNDPSYDGRVGNLERLNRIRATASQGGVMFGPQSVANPYPTESNEDGTFSEGGQSPEKRQRLNERVRHHRGR